MKRTVQCALVRGRARMVSRCNVNNTQRLTTVSLLLSSDTW